MRLKLEKEQKIFFGFILLLCAIAIVIAVYIQFFVQVDEIEKYQEMTSKEEENLKLGFEDLFDNKIHSKEYDMSNLEKVDAQKEIIVTKNQKKEKEDGKYELNVSIPSINLKGDTITKYNQEIQNIFEAKANSVVTSASVNTIYEVKYVAFIHEDILSLVIKSILKEGNNPQRMIVKAYNFNLEEQKEVAIYDITSKKNLEKSAVEKKILNEIKWKNHQAQQLEQSGYPVYKRDIDSKIYQFDNIKNFFIDDNGNLYVLYAYGNNNITSELDVIIF